MNVDEVGRTAVTIASVLWRDLVPTSTGGELDRQGVDAIQGSCRVQVKGDQRIRTSQNIYHEIWEKTLGQPTQPWRRSPGLADVYIFVTTEFALRVTVDALAIAEKGRPLTQISATSMGFLIPISGVSCERRNHAYALDGTLRLF